ncbi:MAG TPA: hypothetical protein VK086_02230, partial [Ruania sp.]|nr:hypothetical protein [Ruania sp.]
DPEVQQAFADSGVLELSESTLAEGETVADWVEESMPATSAGSGELIVSVYPIWQEVSTCSLTR